MHPLVLLLSLAHFGSPFGTDRFLGNREHERITRAALACHGPKTPDCFEPASIDQLAGRGWTFGAVGDPDKPRKVHSIGEDIVEGPLAHCDDGDFLADGYLRSREISGSMLNACFLHLRSRMGQGVTAAGDMLDADSLLVNDQVKSMECEFLDDPSDNAKCKALQGFGRALHGVQDFYSHSNWADVADQDRISVSNPPGLHRSEIAPVLNLRSKVIFDFTNKVSILYGLTTGCYAGFLRDYSTPILKEFTACKGRITHETLSKDEGKVDPDTGRTSAPGSSRGKIANNFDDAVQGAIKDTQRQWKDFRQSLQEQYGSLKADRIACALTHDDPALHCQGSRKIGIVIDSSGSNILTDPKNLRISAARDLNKQLLTKEKTNTPDLVTVIDFDDVARVIYPLGDPKGADAVFSKIDSIGGTNIAAGLRAAIDEITRAPSKASGIVVLTDGQDSNVAALNTQIERATHLGIRVSFGFLSPMKVSKRDSQTDLQKLIVGSGGVYGTITSAEAQQAFIELVIGRGPTNTDNNLGLSILNPGLSISDSISDRDKYFVFKSTGNQKINITVTSEVSLTVTVRDIQRNTEVANGASILFSTACSRDLEITVSATTGSHLFAIELQVSSSTRPYNDPDNCLLELAPPAPENPWRVFVNSSIPVLDPNVTNSSTTMYSSTSSYVSTYLNTSVTLNESATVSSGSYQWSAWTTASKSAEQSHGTPQWSAWITPTKTVEQPSDPSSLWFAWSAMTKPYMSSPNPEPTPLAWSNIQETAKPSKEETGAASSTVISEISNPPEQINTKVSVQSSASTGTTSDDSKVTGNDFILSTTDVVLPNATSNLPFETTFNSASFTRGSISKMIVLVAVQRIIHLMLF